MKPKILWVLIGILITIAVTVKPEMGAAANNPREVIFQVATLGSLMQGVYDGEVSFGQLKAYGDTGIGTFNGLDGEMIFLDGMFYQIKADGKAYPVADGVQTPFAAVTFLDKDQTVQLDAIQNFATLTKLINSQLATSNIFYAIRIDADFDFVKVRSVPKQEKPYPVLTEVTKNQPVFEYRNIKGTVIGLYCPPFTGGINLPGYHFHFISADRNVGGHLLECGILQGTAVLDATHELNMVLPGTPEFYRVDLNANREEDVKKAER